MHQTLFYFVSLIITLNCFSQSDLENEVFEKILEYEFRSGFSVIQCKKSKTDFDYKSLNQKTENKIPTDIIQELKEQSEKSQTSNWSTDLFNNGCLNNEDLKTFYNNESEKNSVLLISDPLFNSNQDHCVISIEYVTYGGMSYGTSYFMKKEYGMWTIVTEFNTWMR